MVIFFLFSILTLYFFQWNEGKLCEMTMMRNDDECCHMTSNDGKCKMKVNDVDDELDQMTVIEVEWR